MIFVHGLDINPLALTGGLAFDVCSHLHVTVRIQLQVKAVMRALMLFKRSCR